MDIILDTHEEAERRGDLSTSLEYNKQFHRVIHRSADNRNVIEIIERYWVLIDALRIISDVVAPNRAAQIRITLVKPLRLWSPSISFSLAKLDSKISVLPEIRVMGWAYLAMTNSPQVCASLCRAVSARQDAGKRMEESRGVVPWDFRFASGLKLREGYNSSW